MAGFLLDDELTVFLQSGISVCVGTRNTALEPYATRACGLRVLSRDRLEVLLPHATSAQAVDNLQQNGDIVVTACSPATFHTVQLKGKMVQIGDCTPDDVLLSEQQLRGFADFVARFGYTLATARNMWLFESWRVEVQVNAAFAQTPGPGAGARMETKGG